VSVIDQAEFPRFIRPSQPERTKLFRAVGASKAPGTSTLPIYARTYEVRGDGSAYETGLPGLLHWPWPLQAFGHGCGEHGANSTRNGPSTFSGKLANIPKDQESKE
jgi:hypothetical protein